MNIEEKKKELLEILTNEAYDFNNFEYSTLENKYDNNLISYYVYEEIFNALTVSFTIDIRTIDKDTFTKLVKDAVELFKKNKPELLTKEEFNYIDTDALNLSNLMSLYPTNMRINNNKFKQQLNNIYGDKEYVICVNHRMYRLRIGDFVKLYIKYQEYSEVGIFEGVSDEGIMVYDDGGRTSTTAIKSINAIGTFKKGGN